MRPDPETGLQMLGVHELPDQFVTVVVQPVEHSATDIVAASFLSPVHRLSMIAVVALRPGRMQSFVILLVVGLLEQDVRTYTGFMQLPVVFHSGSGNVDVDTTDGSVAGLGGIDGFYRLQDVFDRIAYRVLPCLHGQPLVAHVLEGTDFRRNLFLRKLLARDLAVLPMVRAVHATVYAIVRKVKRSEQHDAVAIQGLLDLLSQLEHLLVEIFDVAVQQDGRLPVGQSLQGRSLVQDFLYQSPVAFVPGSIFEGFQYFLVADELFGVA